MKHLIISSLFLVACGRNANDLQIDNGQSLASGVTISRVSLYQGPETRLSDYGVQATPDLPIIAGRDGYVRVFYDAPGQAGVAATGVLELSTGEVYQQPATLVEASTEASVSSTFNFQVPGEAITEAGFDYRVYIVDEANSSGEDTLGAIHPDEGFELHATEREHIFKVTLVPYQYNADGSGRVPDTSPAAIAALEDRFRQLYPISDIELTVLNPIPWNGAIQPNGTGWQEVGLNLYSLRLNAGAANDEYYYAMFNPASSLSQFCGGGCLLGVTLLNTDADPTLNLALGVGFPEQVADTMAHEIGHSHGRPHANCGPGLDPQSIDPNYPYPGGTIGELAYDIVGGGIIPSTQADIMSYCYPQWISDYNYLALWNRAEIFRSAAVARSDVATALPGELIVIEGDGVATWVGSDMDLPWRSGKALEVRAGFAEQVEGRFVAWDHMPGGWLILPSQPDHVDTLSFELEGVRYEVSR